jgi:hypothetical protein
VPKAGETDILVYFLEQLDGSALNYASKALFVAAGWNLSWVDAAGVALTTQPDWDLVVSSGKRHQFEYTVPAGPWAVVTTIPSTHLINPIEYTGEGTTYDIDDIGARLATITAVPISPTATSSVHTMYDGDSIDVSVAIPEAALTVVGASSLADGVTLQAYIKRDDRDSNDDPDVLHTDLTAVATSDDPDDRVVRVTKTAFPSAIGVPDDGDTVSATLHVRLIKSGKEVIAGEAKLAIKWIAGKGEAVDA